MIGMVEERVIRSKGTGSQGRIIPIFPIPTHKQISRTKFLLGGKSCNTLLRNTRHSFRKWWNRTLRGQNYKH